MEMNMVTEKLILDSNRFIMLDLVNTISENETTKSYPIVQIVNPLNKNSYQDIEAIKNRIGNSIKLDEERKDLFTITLNVDADFINQLSS
jgi:enolase